jgi:hypothetical protein
VRAERRTVIALIDEVVAILEQGVSPEEMLDGWSPENRRIVADVLAELRGRLEDPRPLRPGDVRPSLSRDIDDLGISPQGNLANHIARISVLSNVVR